MIIDNIIGDGRGEWCYDHYKQMENYINRSKDCLDHWELPRKAFVGLSILKIRFRRRKNVTLRYSKENIPIYFLGLLISICADLVDLM